MGLRRHLRCSFKIAIEFRRPLRLIQIKENASRSVEKERISARGVA